VTRRRSDNARQAARLLELAVETFSQKAIRLSSLAFENASPTRFFSTRLGLFIVAIPLRVLQRNHGSNIECHAAQVGGQSIEEVALPCLGGKFANEGAILRIGQQLFEPCL
jgi:hypothetical protein